MVQPRHLTNGRLSASRIPALSAALALVLTLSLAPAVSAGAPSNDDFTAAVRAKVLPFTSAADTTDATRQTDEPTSSCVFNDTHTVWYRYTAPKTKYVRADTQHSGYDTALAVWRGSSLAALTEVACNDDIRTGDGTFIGGSRVTWRAVAGVRYYIQAGGSNGNSGSLKFRLRRVKPPANDNMARATRIASFPVSLIASNRSATEQSGELASQPSSCGDDAKATLWYRVTSATSTVLRADTLGSLNDTIVAVSTGKSFANRVERACSDDTMAGGSFTWASSTAWKAHAGVHYFVQAAGWGGDTGSIHFHVQRVTPPANDDWSNAQNVVTLPYTVDTNTRSATKEPLEYLDDSCSDENWQTVWYAYQATGTNPLQATVTVTDSKFTVAVVVYTGADLGSLAEVGCDRITGPDTAAVATFTPVNGTTYYIKVTAQVGKSGPSTFDLREAP